MFIYIVHELVFEGLMLSPSSSYIAVVAIDFGTTYSGFAFAFNHNEGEGGIHMNRKWGYARYCNAQNSDLPTAAPGWRV